MIHYKIKRLIETTLPIIVMFGLVVAFVTKYIGLWMGLIAIFLFAFWDVMFTTKE